MREGEEVMRQGGKKRRCDTKKGTWRMCCKSEDAKEERKKVRRGGVMKAAGRKEGKII